MQKFVLTTLVLVSGALFAEEARVKVKGMVCGFCAQGITKKLKSEKSVEKVNVDLDSKYVTIDFKGKNNLSDSEIEKLISDAGYTVDQIERQRQ